MASKVTKTDKKITKITELSSFNNFNFLDEAKKNKNVNVTMFSIYPNGFLKEITNIHCWNDKCEFNWEPIGIPLRYVSDQIIKTYTSEITKDKYTIKENVSSFYDDKINENDRIQCKKIEKGYYESEGIFCSFNCALAYINENKHNPMYKDSKILLNKIYKDCYGKLASEIEPAPSWKVLDIFGGYMTIDEMRLKMKKYQFIDNGLIYHKDIFKTVGSMIEEKQKF